MLTPEETSVLQYLNQHPGATAAEVARQCLPGTSPEWVDRIASNLDWLGYAIVYHGQGGEVAALQITDRGRQAIGGKPSLSRLRRPAI